ncbi:MAG: DUF3048 domain-containing protein [Actinomycetota bacterium]
MSTFARRAALALASALIVAACGGGGDSDADEPTETSAAVETTAGSESTTTTDATDPTTASVVEVAGPVAPLTGLPDEAGLDRPALAVKIDNHPQNARPQVGINQADLVIEETVEGNITRLIAVFHTETPDPIGPVRSARTQDVVILANLGNPLFANSGGNAGTMSAVRNSDDLVNANVDQIPGAFYREARPRFAPHNLFANTTVIYENASDLSGRPAPLFDFLAAGDGPPEWATPATGVDLAYGGIDVNYTWDDSAEGWARLQSGTPHVDGDEVQVAPANVVVLETEYGRSSADPGSPEARVTGTGTAWVFTQGTVQQGTWERETPQDVATLTSDSGEPMVLTPGHTWIALPRPDRTTITG